VPAGSSSTCRLPACPFTFNCLQLTVKGWCTSTPLLQIVFCRQRPHKSTASNDEWKAVWKVTRSRAGPCCTLQGVQLLRHPVRPLPHHSSASQCFAGYGLSGCLPLRRLEAPELFSQRLHEPGRCLGKRAHCSVQNALHGMRLSGRQYGRGCLWNVTSKPLNNRFV
jgi:hypothetical protein